MHDNNRFTYDQRVYRFFEIQTFKGKYISKLA